MKTHNPLNFLTLDQSNYLLARGNANKEHALEYIERWNTGGKRLTRLELRERVSYVNKIEIIAPYMAQKD
jgi:hypothetical protein